MISLRTQRRIVKRKMLGREWNRSLSNLPLIAGEPFNVRIAHFTIENIGVKVAGFKAGFFIRKTT
eukprot:snap_masked-scaffold_4-processed-gene-17.28-mRNA-1 protein AED:1.00 eAED:1.00 QI:0/0/0/0/1/1/2/0/64